MVRVWERALNQGSHSVPRLMSPQKSASSFRRIGVATRGVLLPLACPFPGGLVMLLERARATDGGLLNNVVRSCEGEEAGCVCASPSRLESLPPKSEAPSNPDMPVSTESIASSTFFLK